MTQKVEKPKAEASALPSAITELNVQERQLQSNLEEISVNFDKFF
jgi:hypothetical protein